SSLKSSTCTRTTRAASAAWNRSRRGPTKSCSSASVSQLSIHPPSRWANPPSMHGTFQSSATAQSQGTDAPGGGPSLDATIAAAFLIVVFASACLMPLQSDFWWHLRAGQEMWFRHIIALADEFSFTATGSYWPNHEWLSEIVLFAAYRAAGLPGVTVVAAVCVTTAMALSWRLTPGPSI